MKTNIHIAKKYDGSRLCICKTGNGIKDCQNKAKVRVGNLYYCNVHASQRGIAVN